MFTLEIKVMFKLLPQFNISSIIKLTMYIRIHVTKKTYFYYYIIIYEARQSRKTGLDLQDKTALFTNVKGIIINLRILMEKQTNKK